MLLCLLFYKFCFNVMMRNCIKSATKMRCIIESFLANSISLWCILECINRFEPAISV